MLQVTLITVNYVMLQLSRENYFYKSSSYFENVRLKLVWTLESLFTDLRNAGQIK